MNSKQPIERIPAIVISGFLGSGKTILWPVHNDGQLHGLGHCVDEKRCQNGLETISTTFKGRDKSAGSRLESPES